MSQGTVSSAASRPGTAAGPQRGIDTILLRIPVEPRLSLLPTLRAAIDRARRVGGRIAVTVPENAAPGLRDRAETALMALGLPADRLHRGGLPVISRPAPAPAADTALLDALPLFPTADEVQVWAARLPTDGRQAGEPKDPEASAIFHAYALLADPMRTETLRLRFHGGISWEDARMALVQLVLRLTAEAGRRQAELLAEDLRSAS